MLPCLKRKARPKQRINCCKRRRNDEERQAKEKPRMKDIPRNVEPYFIALLLKGERWNDTQGADVADLVPRQLAFIREQVEAGRYLLAGPITDDGPLVGISIIAAGYCRGSIGDRRRRSRGPGGTIEGGGASSLSALVEGIKDQLFLAVCLSSLSARRTAAAIS